MLGNSLKVVDFALPEEAPLSGLVPVHEDGASTRPDEQAVINDAKLFDRVDYVFFRRFEDGRSSQVAAFVVDNSTERLAESQLAKLHHDLWLHGMAPLVYIGWPTRVDILSCARGPDFWKHNARAYEPASSVDAITTAAEVNAALVQRNRFSAHRLADGTFWDDPENRALAAHSEAAHQRLIQAIVEADTAIKGATKPVLRRLLVLTVLVKYLEDRRVFPPDWFQQFSRGATTFFDVLKAGSPDGVRNLLEALENKFNGDVFALSAESPQFLSESALRSFAKLVEAKTLNAQRYLWQQYSFEHLPVEVISRLYQRFVTGGHGAVYTPPYLASLLLDQVMPYHKLTGSEKVLDPACGSGIFLVGAFRRLVNHWRSCNDWQTPSVDVLKGILQRNIFGIELDSGAVDLTAFSLALGVCDALKPNVIWDQLKFDRLRDRNLFAADFFGNNTPPATEEAWPKKFDVVIGNPPFESDVTLCGKLLNDAREKDRGLLPDNQAAHLFLEQGLQLLAPNGHLCLIQPSGFLYNRKTAAFRASIFNTNHIQSTLDFTSIRSMYDGADPKTIALLASAEKPTEESVTIHLTFRRTFSTYQQIGFELDHYDRHRVPQPLAEKDLFVWRANLLGGGRLVEMSQRLQRMTTLEDFVGRRHWEYGEGFIAATTGKREPAAFLTGQPLLPTKAFTKKGIDKRKIGRLKDTHFRSAYTAERYSPPLVLIKENEELPVAFWDDGFVAYRAKIVGIHAPAAQRDSLVAFYDLFKRRQRLYRFCSALNGSQGLVGKATAILKLDIDALPFPDDPRDLQFSFWEELLKEDVLTHMIPYVRLGQNSPLLTKAATSDDLELYARTFCRLLGSVYQNLRASPAVFLNGLICQAFYFGTKPEVDWPVSSYEHKLRTLIENRPHASLRTLRVIRFYTKNVILIVKPDRLRYWIASTAVRDADESVIDLHRQGY